MCISMGQSLAVFWNSCFWVKMQKSTFLEEKGDWVWFLSDLKNNKTNEILLRVNFCDFFKILHFSSFFFEIFEIHQELVLKWLNALYFIWTL